MVKLRLWFLKHGVISAVVFNAINGCGRMPTPPVTVVTKASCFIIISVKKYASEGLGLVFLIKKRYPNPLKLCLKRSLAKLLERYG